MGLHKGSKASAGKVLVVGTGAFAQGLVSLAHRSGASASYAINFGNRRVPAGATSILPGLEESPVCCIADVINEADMVILALPASGLPFFVAAHGAQLAGKVVVDVTNPMRSDLYKLGSVDPSEYDWACDVEGKDTDQDIISAFKALGTGGDSYLPSSTATWLSAMLPSSACVVKAFCNLSAYTLLHGDPLTEHMKSVAAADSAEAAAAVADLGRAMGLQMRVVSSLAYASKLEARQHSLLPAWQWPCWLMLGTWLVVHIYSFIRYNYYGGSRWEHITMWILNKSVGWVALWGMVYTYLPGVLVCYMQLFLRRPAVRLPGWLKAWMDARKQLGLLSLAATMLHLLLSTFLWMPSYYAKLWDHSDTAIVPIINGTGLDQFGMMKDSANIPAGVQLLLDPHNITYAATNSTILSTFPVAPLAGAPAMANATAHPVEALSVVTNIITIRSKLNWIGESSTFLGIISGCLMGLIALTSVPCVTPKMNWVEWRLLQSHSGWLAVITATVHVLLLGAPWWPRYKTDWPQMIPTITLLSTLPPMLLLVMKGLISLPPLSIALARIRSGAWAHKDSSTDAMAHAAVFAVKHH